ncbi:membrane protein [Paucilactobacillus hokkaidonensis JCM 18461]|uniref:Membrane protein n=1 Tax=Paucilactobacillus hokkaidonensis JCM 18461 TaxID=1291742 RepID=A0A0A1GVK4_9LACO|nr:hypothetical protein [Paucilactobacillus hokkaidonensis]BAP85044.1 membrane protein [Paucilactobacillus hokkaidonensis JCM 18461]
MKFYMYLPRDKKEFILFMAIVSLISVNIIAPLITSFEIGFGWQTWKNVLSILPMIWIAVIAMVLLTYQPASWLTGKIVEEQDGFNAHIIVNILCTVMMMSVILTVVGTWIGQQQVSLESISHFFYRWPRNFAISLGVEMLIAQPIARQILFILHSHQETEKTTN